MVDTRETFTEHEEMEMLLPWFVTGRLDAKDRARVGQYIEAHPDMRVQLDLIRDELGENISANEALGGAPAGALDKLRAAVAAEPKRITVAAVRQSLWNELTKLLSAPTPRAVQWAGAAAVVVLVAQAAIIGGLLTKPAGGPAGNQPQIAQRGTAPPQVARREVTQPKKSAARRFSVASGTVTQGTRVLVRFVPNVSFDKIAKFLRSEHAEIVAGPKPGGFFEVRISTKKLSQSEKDTAIAKLKSALGLVHSVVR